MSIIYIITQADDGGAQKYVLTLANHFKGAIAAGSEAEKLFKAANNLPALPAGRQLTTYKLKHLKRDIHLWHDFLAIWEIRRLIKKLKPNIVHLNSTKAGFLGSFACIGLPVKIVFTAHGFRFLEPLSPLTRLFSLWIEKLAGQFRNFIITVSDADKKSALENNLIAENKIQTIHNGIRPINFLPRDEAKKVLNLPLFSKEGAGGSSKFIVGTLANFYKTKGLDVLIEAINLLPIEIKTQCQFVFLGSGPDFENCKFKIENYGLTNNILLLGNIPNASKYLKAFDLFILPSRKEGFPYAILEAMQAGLPILATDVGGIPEAVGDAGIIIPAEDPLLLSKTIRQILFDEPLKKELSQKALKRSETFTEKTMLSKTDEIYRSIDLMTE